MGSIISNTRTLEEVFASFMGHRGGKGLSPNTIDYYDYNLGKFIDWMLARGRTEFEAITRQDLSEYFLHLGTQRNTGGVHTVFRAVRALFNFYQEENEGFYCNDAWQNPIKKVKVKTPSIEPLPGIPISQVRQLVAVCRTVRDRAIILCLVDTGARGSEFCALNVGDVDMMTGAVEIRFGKGGKRRTVFLGNDSRRALRKYLRTRPKETLTPESPLWMWENREPFYNRLRFVGLREVVRRASVKAGLRKTPGLHDFRRCFALTMYNNGADLLAISRLLGHTSTEVTRRYLDIGDRELQRSVLRASPADTVLRQYGSSTR